MRDMHKCDIDMGWLPTRDYMGDHTVDSTKLRNATGWEPEGEIENQIRDVAHVVASVVNEAKEWNTGLFYE